jgi:hypothetical protein
MKEKPCTKRVLEQTERPAKKQKTSNPPITVEGKKISGFITDLDSSKEYQIRVTAKICKYFVSFL